MSSTTNADADSYEQFVTWGQNLESNELSQLVAQITADWSSSRSEFLIALITALELDETHLLDTAAGIAAQHHALTDHKADVRNLLALYALQDEFSQQLADGPRNIIVIDDVERRLMNRARWRGEAMAAIWQEPMLEARVAAVALGVKPANREKVSQFRQRSWLLGLPSARRYLYPEFQFDPRRSDVYAAVRTVNEMLNAVSDPWGVASRWFSPHARLGVRPADLVGADPTSIAAAHPDDHQAIDRAEHWEDDLVAAAEAVIEPVG